jgi:hypothetical protein
VPPSFTDLPASQLLQVAKEHGLVGVVAERRSSRYEPGRRSPAWVKTALLTTQEVVIGGWTPWAGRHAGTLGALLLGAYDPAGQLRYLGNVGTGFTDGALRDLLVQLAPLQRSQSPFDDAVPREQARPTGGTLTTVSAARRRDRLGALPLGAHRRGWAIGSRPHCSRSATRARCRTARRAPKRGSCRSAGFRGRAHAGVEHRPRAHPVVPQPPPHADRAPARARMAAARPAG